MQSYLPSEKEGATIWKVGIDLQDIKPQLFTVKDPGFELRVLAKDNAGHVNFVSRWLTFAWETGDKLLWRKDNSTLVYHDAVKSENMDPFWMQETEVTNRQYRQFLEAQGGKYDFSKWFWPVEAPRQLGDLFYPRSKEWVDGICPEQCLDDPVRGVSWLEARAYAKWAGLEIPRRSEWLVAAFWDYKNLRYKKYPWEPMKNEVKGALPIWCGKKDGPTSVWSEAVSNGNTPQGLRHMLGNLWEFVAPDAGMRFPAKVGGGFKEDQRYFISSEHKAYLWGELSAQTPIYEDQWGVSYSDLGFRCILKVK